MPEIAQGISPGISPEQDAAIQRALARKKGLKPTAAKGKLPDPKKFGSGALDKNSFLKLLVTQLQKQDPTNPMNDKEFISQMAQFSSLEQMNNVANSMNRMRASQATHFIGKMVVGKDIETEQPIQGIAVGARYEADGEVLLQIGNNFSKMDDIRQVTQVTPFEQPMHSSATLPPVQNVSRETLPTAPLRPAQGDGQVVVSPSNHDRPIGTPSTSAANQAAKAYEANQKAAPKAAQTVAQSATKADVPARVSPADAGEKTQSQKINVPKGE